MSAARVRGIQGEVLASLAFVMLTATTLLAALMLKAHADQLSLLRDLVGRSLIEDAQSPLFTLREHSPGVEWWILSPESRQQRRLSSFGTDVSERDWELAVAAQADDEGLTESGAPWEPIRFAIRLGPSVIGAQKGEVALARIAPMVSGSAVFLLLVLDSGIFGLLGVYLLRRRVVQPLRRLGEAARSLSLGGLHTRVPVEGVGEVADLAASFNEMGEALERRTNALEKAVSDLREANGQLRRARAGLERNERLAAVGRLAAGVAHEIGNPMGAILAFLNLAERDTGITEVGRRHLARAGEQGERVREILRQLLDFSRPPRAARSSFDLHHVAEQVIGLVSAQPRYARIEISLQREADTRPALGDASLTSQVLLNLLLNAAEAVAEVEQPRIQVRLGPAALDRRSDDTQGASQRRCFDAVECTVIDNGPGIQEEDRGRVFDPFFTTRPPGEGTGLGLANALSLIQEQGGALELDPVGGDGEGASFRFRLPSEAGEGARPPGSLTRGDD